jgi:low temperature requirement protein LtrA
VVVGGLLTVFSMWWIYFDMPADELIQSVRQAFSERLTGAFTWGYGNYLVFAGATAVGVGLSVAVDQVTHHSELTDLQAGFVLTVPAVVYLVAVWGLHVHIKPPSAFRNYAVPVVAVLILLSSFTSEPVLFTGLLLAALVATSVVLRPRLMAQ